MHLTQALSLIFVAFFVTETAARSSIQCTPGRSWTKGEFAEYKNLDSTKGWSGMDVISHCDIIHVEDSGSSHREDTGDATNSPHTNELQGSAGDYVWIPYDTWSCSGEGINYVFSWSYGICSTIHGAEIYSAELANGFESNEDFPIVEYYPEPRCQGKAILLHVCNSTGRYGARSALLYSGDC